MAGRTEEKGGRTEEKSYHDEARKEYDVAKSEASEAKAKAVDASHHMASATEGEALHVTDRASQRVGEAREYVADKAQGAKESAEESAGRAREYATDTGEQAKETAGRTVDTARGKAEDVRQSAQETGQAVKEKAQAAGDVVRDKTAFPEPLRPSEETAATLRSKEEGRAQGLEAHTLNPEDPELRADVEKQREEQRKKGLLDRAKDLAGGLTEKLHLELGGGERQEGKEEEGRSVERPGPRRKGTFWPVPPQETLAAKEEEGWEKKKEEGERKEEGEEGQGGEERPSSMLGKAKQAVVGTVGAVEEKAEGLAHGAKERVGEVAQGAKDKVGEAEQWMESQEPQTLEEDKLAHGEIPSNTEEVTKKQHPSEEGGDTSDTSPPPGEAAYDKHAAEREQEEGIALRTTELLEESAEGYGGENLGMDSNEVREVMEEAEGAGPHSTWLGSWGKGGSSGGDSAK